mgnify:CR=1 FL=1
MKKIVTCLGLMAFSFGASAQGIEIFLPEEDTDISGTVYELSSEESDMHQEFDVKNVSGGELTLRIERFKVIELEGTEDYLCWGANPETGACYSASLVSPENPFVTPDSSPLGDGLRGWLSTYHVSHDISGCAQYRYYVINEWGDRLDSVDVRYCSTVSIEEDTKIEVSVYPNPATEIVNISLNEDSKNVSFSLYNVLGDVVLSTKLVAGTNTVKVGALPNGMYFYSILKEGDVIETKKLVVRH